MTKIPPGEYSVEKGTLVNEKNGDVLLLSNGNVHKLEIRERSAEEVLAKHLGWDKYADGPIIAYGEQIINAMKEYRSQPIAPVSEKEITKIFEGFSKHNEMDLDFVRHAFIPLKNKILAALTPSITSVTIGDNNNIIDFKYK